MIQDYQREQEEEDFMKKADSHSNIDHRGRGREGNHDHRDRKARRGENPGDGGVLENGRENCRVGA